jgi:hypothetical protein
MARNDEMLCVSSSEIVARNSAGIIAKVGSSFTSAISRGNVASCVRSLKF